MWYFITLIAPVLWGTSYAFMESGLDNGLPLWNALFRALPAGLLLLLIKPVAFDRKTLSYGSMVGFLNIGVFFVCMFIATYRIPGSLVATLGATMPIQVMIIRRVLYGVKPDAWQIAAGFLGLFGVYLLLSGSEMPLDAIGVGVALLGMFSMSLATVIMQHHGMTENVIGFMGTQLVAGAVFILPIAYVVEGSIPSYNTSEIMTLGWLSVVNTAIGYLIWLYGIKRIGVFNASLLTLINPVVAVLLGVLYMKDQISLIQFMAIGLILFSVSLPNLSVCLLNGLRTFFKRDKKSELAVD